MLDHIGQVSNARKALHYDAHRLEHVPPKAEAHFYNQLTDDATWPLSSEGPLLLAPAIKSHKESGVADQMLPQTPEYRHHFVCYAVAPNSRPWIKVEDTKPHHIELLDQFDTNEEKIQKLQPAYFCFLVEKRYGDAWEQPTNDIGLALYTIDPRRSYVHTVFARDQFDWHTAAHQGKLVLASCSIARRSVSSGSFEFGTDTRYVLFRQGHDVQSTSPVSK